MLLWVEACCTTFFFSSRRRHTILNNKTPEEAQEKLLDEGKLEVKKHDHLLKGKGQ
jgi:hypothetical protein